MNLIRRFYARRRLARVRRSRHESTHMLPRNERRRLMGKNYWGYKIHKDW